MPKPKSTKIPSDTAIKTPRPTDILFGRGGHVNHHRMNQIYLQLVCNRKDEYQNCKKVNKAVIAWGIIRELREQHNPVPRFLKKNYSTGMWHIVKDDDVRRKISQCLRERAAPVLPRKNKNKLATVKKKSRNGNHSIKTMTHADPAVMEPSTSLKDALSLNEVLVRKMEEMPPLVIQATAASPSTLSKEAQRLQSHEISAERQREFEALESQDAVDVISGPSVPIPQPSRFGATAKGWSDFLAGSFNSFTPSVVDAAGAENAWENLLDPSTLPQLTNDDEDEGSQTSDESSVQVSITWQKQISVGVSDSGKAPAATVRQESISTDDFFGSDVMSLSKVLENSYPAGSQLLDL